MKTICSPLQGLDAPLDESDLIRTDRKKEEGLHILDVDDQTESREMDRVLFLFFFHVPSSSLSASCLRFPPLTLRQARSESAGRKINQDWIDSVN